MPAPLRGVRSPKHLALSTVACLVVLFQFYLYYRGSRCSQQKRPVASLSPEATVVLTEQVSGTPQALTSAATAPFRLPKVIHQTVRDKGQLSCQQRKGIVSWKALNPGYSHRLWDDADIQRFMEQHYPDLVPLPFNDFLAGAERSDLWRMLVLHKLGGVYADLDVQCLQPIAQWNAEHGFDAQVLLGVENYEAAREHPLHVNNWVLAAVPGHPLLGSMPDIVSKTIQQQFFKLAKQKGTLSQAAYEAGIIDRTGPAALSWAVYEYLSKHAGVDMSNVSEASVTSPEGLSAGGVRLLPVDYMSAGWEVALARQQGRNYTCDGVGRDKPQALVCHMFHGSWRSSWRFGQEQTRGNEC